MLLPGSEGISYGYKQTHINSGGGFNGTPLEARVGK